MSYAHMLVPTDGTEASQHAIDQAVALAKHAGARITGYHLIEPLPSPSGMYASMADLREREAYPARASAVAREHLAVIEASAREAGVPCTTYFELSGKHPYEAIIDAARANGCDLIVMGTHARRGLDAVFLGSETHKVLTHTEIPVLVTH